MSLGSEGGIPAVMNVTPSGGAGYNNGGFGGWGGDWMAFIVLFLLFGMFGWGGFGGGWGGNGNGALTRADLCSEFNFNGLENGVRGIQQGICDSTFALNNSIMGGFHGVDNAICNLGFTTQQGFNALQAQMASCCCDTQRAIDGVNYNMATQACAIQTAMASNTRDIIDSQNAGTRAILDYLCQDKISSLQSENQALRLAASQSSQNAVLMAAMDANKAEILRKTGAECPMPAYVVQPPQPVTFPTNCCGQVNYAGGNCGCGC